MGGIRYSQCLIMLSISCGRHYIQSVFNYVEYLMLAELDTVSV